MEEINTYLQYINIYLLIGEQPNQRPQEKCISIIFFLPSVVTGEVVTAVVTPVTVASMKVHALGKVE